MCFRIEISKECKQLVGQCKQELKNQTCGLCVLLVRSICLKTCQTCTIMLMIVNWWLNAAVSPSHRTYYYSILPLRGRSTALGIYHILFRLQGIHLHIPLSHEYRTIIHRCKHVCTVGGLCSQPPVCLCTLYVLQKPVNNPNEKVDRTVEKVCCFVVCQHNRELCRHLCMFAYTHKHKCLFTRQQYILSDKFL